ncbi:hypothetical protein A6395_13345 [Exiguobacterium sp. SH31]|uniref:hypothetical protein n=1 Tax=Exiguobacterium sp. SH31 TaxID=1843183 RepID=UPI0008B5A3CF|nr:hypothetical protein [Exiguobacterium sp. SH31]OGX78201.1 hypothetical protein A6395_13345 [Exiguobacterium sp. SH31]
MKSFKGPSRESKGHYREKALRDALIYRPLLAENCSATYSELKAMTLDELYTLNAALDLYNEEVQAQMEKAKRGKK